jgi:molecular chaperone DnaJ
MSEKDLYAELGLSRTASSDDIKKAYRKLARKHHPDVNPGNKEAEERFKAISEAHDVLSDAKKRKLYDEFGSDGIKTGFDAEQARAYREQSAAWQQRGGSRGTTGFGGYESFEDLFGDILSNRGRGNSQSGADFESEIEIDLLDAVRGLSTTVTVQRAEACTVCAGNGIDLEGSSVCPDCSGQGRVKMGGGPVGFTRVCPRCGGVGRTGTKPCKSCGGAGQKPKNEKLNIRIPPGVDTGSRVRVAGKGGPGSSGGEAGDLFIRVRVRPHSLLERRGDDLYMDLPVTVGEAIEGAAITVPTAEASVRVHVPAASQTGRLLRVKGHGVPHLKGSGRGDLYLRIAVHVPDQKSEAVSAAGQTIDAAYSRNPREGLRL